jgi:hypothetical protein
MIGILVMLPLLAYGEFDPSLYKEITQAEMVAHSKENAGKKFRVTDLFQFCGSDFCVEIRKTNINTKDYYCFALGSPCLVRLYIKKTHPEAQAVMDLKRGEKVTAYGTYESMGSDYHYMVVDHIAVEKKR